MPEIFPSNDEDLPLVQKAQAGDQDAFDALVKKYQTMMTGLLYRFAPNRADLEDMVQDTFVRAWRALPRWYPDKPFLHWLKRIASNVGLEFCRKQNCSPFGRLAHPEEHPFENLAADGAEEQPGRGAVEEAQFLLAQVPAEDRALLTMLYLNEMPLSEIAEHFGWSRANAKIKAFRARNRLKTILENHGYTLF